MIKLRCAFSASSALTRVFLPAATGHESAAHLPRFLAPTAVLSSTRVPRRWAQYGVRPQQENGDDSNVNDDDDDNNNNKKKKTTRLPRDGEIAHPMVQMRQEDGSLSEPHETAAVLGSMDRTVYSLVALALPRKVDGVGWVPRWPVCKVVNRREEAAAERERAKTLRRLHVQSKEMEINWAIAPHDLEHKLRQLRQFLEKGFKVQVLLAKKRKSQRTASAKEAKDLVAQIKDLVEEIPGAREFKAQEGQLLETMKLHYEGSKSSGKLS